MLLFGDVVWGSGFMFLIWWGGYWEELIESLGWGEEGRGLGNLIGWRDKGVGVWIVEGGLVGLGELCVGYILSYGGLLIGCRWGKFG